MLLIRSMKYFVFFFQHFNDCSQSIFENLKKNEEKKKNKRHHVLMLDSLFAPFGNLKNILKFQKKISSKPSLNSKNGCAIVLTTNETIDLVRFPSPELIDVAFLKLRNVEPFERNLGQIIHEGGKNL